MDNKHFHHALIIDGSICTGCSHCMNVCPTEAIRVRGGKAVLFENRCIDCGECYKSCPVNAIYIDQDDFSRIHNFKYRIALLPAVFSGQFPLSVDQDEIYEAILAAGFTHICEVELSTGLLKEALVEQIESHSSDQPLISSFCPAIIRLIQVRFPALTANIVQLKPPLDIAALYCRKKLVDEGVTPSEIGVFYITPCAAKIAAIKSPVGEDFSIITGVINMDTLYNRVCRNIRNLREKGTIRKNKPDLPAQAIRWTLTTGESGSLPGRCLAIDEIHNVMEFLENIDNKEFEGIDFLELRACDQSCAGGALVSSNRFLVTERLKSEAEHQLQRKVEYPSSFSMFHPYLRRRMGIQPIKPRSMMKWDEVMEVAITKMDQSMEIMNILPKIDCGACGSPSCQSFARDIVTGFADIRQCIFIQKSREKTGELHAEVSAAILKEVWGNDKF